MLVPRPEGWRPHFAAILDPSLSFSAESNQNECVQNGTDLFLKIMRIFFLYFQMLEYRSPGCVNFGDLSFTLVPMGFALVISLCKRVLPLSVQFLKFSCSFWQNVCQINGLRFPLGDHRPSNNALHNKAHSLIKMSYLAIISSNV